MQMLMVRSYLVLFLISYIYISVFEIVRSSYVVFKDMWFCEICNFKDVWLKFRDVSDLLLLSYIFPFLRLCEKMT